MENVVSILIVVVVVLFSMILHELAHGVTAYVLGDSTAREQGRLTLNPFKHLDPILSLALPIMLAITGGPIFGGAKPVPVDSRNLKYGVWGMALVAIAGPLTNFVIAFLVFMIGFFSGGLADLGVVGLILSEVILVNLGFGIFNLIPIPPLDGSRVLYAVAPDGVRGVMDKMENMGILFVMILVILLPNVISTIMYGAMNGILDFFYFLVGVR